MIVLLAALSCAPARPPDLLDEVRHAEASSPLLVQCLLPRLERRRERRVRGVRDPAAMWQAARSAARSRGHVYEKARDYERALEDALARWGASPAEMPGSVEEANRALCLAGRESSVPDAVARLSSGASAGDETRLYLLATVEADGRTEYANGNNPPTVTFTGDRALPGAMFRTYERCWRVPPGTEGPRVAPAAPDLVRTRSRAVTSAPGWEGVREAIAILGDLPAFFTTGLPSWRGLESIHVAVTPTRTLLVLGGSARCHLEADDVRWLGSNEGDLLAFVTDEGKLRRATWYPPRDLEHQELGNLRADGETFVVHAEDGGPWRYIAERPDSGCVPGKGPRWSIEPEPRGGTRR